MKSNYDNKDWATYYSDLTKKYNGAYSNILRDWITYFPELKRYKNGKKLLKRVGPIVFGIEIEKFLPEEYRPRFIAHNLMGSNPSSLIYIVDQPILNWKGLDVTVEYSSHDKVCVDICKKMEHQAYINLSGEVSLHDLIGGILKFIQSKNTTSYLFGHCVLAGEAALQLTSFFRETDTKKEYFDTVIKTLEKKISLNRLEELTGGYENWLIRIRNQCKEDLEKIILENIERYRMEKIPYKSILN